MVSPKKKLQEEDTVLIETVGHIATVTLNRPEKLNALTQNMWEKVCAIFRKLDGEAFLRCIILRGAGEKAFSPGADISEFNNIRNNSQQARRYGDRLHGAMGAIQNCRHPVVACIKGLCVGGGLELALACDIRVSGESGRFGIPINKLGLVMAYPEIQALVKLVGPAIALEILFEGRVFGASEAKEKGLINKIVPDESVDATIKEISKNICAGAPLVNRWHKKFVYRVINGAKQLTEDELAEGFLCFDTKDYKEGVTAFLNKKTPNFEGR